MKFLWKLEERKLLFLFALLLRIEFPGSKSHRAFHWIVEPLEQLYGRALSTTAWTNESGALARLDYQR